MPFVLYELQDHVAVITLNRPERMNALGSELSAELRIASERQLPLVRGASRRVCPAA